MPGGPGDKVLSPGTRPLDALCGALPKSSAKDQGSLDALWRTLPRPRAGNQGLLDTFWRTLPRSRAGNEESLDAFCRTITRFRGEGRGAYHQHAHCTKRGGWEANVFVEHASDVAHLLHVVTTRLPVLLSSKNVCVD